MQHPKYISNDLLQKAKAKCDHLNFRRRRGWRAATHPTFEGVGSATVDLDKQNNHGATVDLYRQTIQS